MKEISQGKRITIEQLATMVAKGFSSVDERLDKIENRLDRIENNHDRRLDVLESRTFTLKSVIENQTKKKIVW